MSGYDAKDSTSADVAGPVFLSFFVAGPAGARESCFIALAPKIRPDKRFVPSEGNRGFFRRETPFHPNEILGGAAGKRPTGQPIQDRGFLG